jgi:hypothetical protein
MTMEQGSNDVQRQEFEAGPDHVIVVYVPPDFGTEVDPVSIFAAIAADAAERAATGLRILSMTTMPLRHGGTMLNTGGGYQTKTSVAVVYERWPGVSG